MSLRNRLVLPMALSTLALLAGCGSSSNKATPPPTGGFSKSDLSGTYVFSTTGSDANGAPTSMAGTFSANGNGGIAGGTLDINDAEFTAPATGLSITGGTYTVSVDGRGQATLSVTTPFGNSVIVDFVLTSKSHGLITEFDNNGSGSGTLDIQSAATQAQLVGSYAFTLSGIDSNGNLPFGTVGSFTLGADGIITSGVEDFNDTGFAYTNLTLSGTVLPQATGAPWVATLTAVDSSDVSPFGTLTFDVYAVDATHLKFVEADNFQNGFPLLAGDAFTQQGASIPSSATTYVFTMAGGTQNSGPLTVGGVLPIDGAGAVSGGYIDINDAGTTTTAPLSFGGSYAASGSVGGRTLFNLSGFQVASQFIAYPTTNAGLQVLESDSAGFLSGVAIPQSSSTFASGQGYGMNVSGFNSVEEDDIAEFTTTSTGFSGLVDLNDEGQALSFDKTLTGTYQIDSPPSGRYDFVSPAFDGELYVVDSSTALFVELDATQVGIGTVQLQNETQSARASRLILPHRTVFPFAKNQKSAARWRHK